MLWEERAFLKNDLTGNPGWPRPQSSQEVQLLFSQRGGVEASFLTRHSWLLHLGRMFYLITYRPPIICLLYNFRYQSSWLFPAIPVNSCHLNQYCPMSGSHIFSKYKAAFFLIIILRVLTMLKPTPGPNMAWPWHPPFHELVEKPGDLQAAKLILQFFSFPQEPVPYHSPHPVWQIIVLKGDPPSNNTFFLNSIHSILFWKCLFSRKTWV